MPTGELPTGGLLVVFFVSGAGCVIVPLRFRDRSRIVGANYRVHVIQASIRKVLQVRSFT